MGQKRPKKVLIAEDEALIRLDLVELLTEEGFEVVGQAADGEEAVKLARELEPDLIIMDVKMPGMDGITAAEIIGEERIAPILMLTAFSQSELVERARDAGVMGYLVKPFGARWCPPSRWPLGVSPSCGPSRRNWRTWRTGSSPGRSSTRPRECCRRGWG